MQRIIGMFLIVIVVDVLPSVAADPIDQAEAQRRGVPVEQVEIEKLKGSVANLEARNKELQAQLAAKQKELSTQTTLLQTQIDTQTAQAQAEIKRLGGQIKLLQQQLLAYMPNDSVGRLDSVPEMTATKLYNIGDQYANKVVKMTAVTFSGADASVLKNLPLLNISGAGIVSVDRTKTEADTKKWVGLAVTDGRGLRFNRICAMKSTYGEMLTDLNKGRKVNLLATVIEFKPKEYGLVCTRIEIVLDDMKTPSPPPPPSPPPSPQRHSHTHKTTETQPTTLPVEEK